ncbi:MAG: hypothetical protein KJ593_04235 [Candidatus Omnitrophica bacterium]|nr:hypothetical protein [Candidatus Omnitrophota bacterium]
MIRQISEWSVRLSKSINNKAAVNLYAVIIMVVVLAILAAAAVVRVTNIQGDATLLSEEALLRSLTKAAMLYNVENDDWYGRNANDDIFAEFLQDPPPHSTATTLFELLDLSGGPDEEWELYYFSANEWYIGCPHLRGISASGGGTAWRFFVEGGKVELLWGPNHIWP